MRFRFPLRAVSVIALVLAVALQAAGWETIPWERAADHDGETVVVEGDVVAARMETIGCVLEFDPGDPKGFRVVIVIPMISDLPRRPDRLYQGKRVRITGRIDVFKGRPEMIVRDPDVIQVVDVATGVAAPLDTATPTTTPPTTTTTPAAIAPAPAPAPAAPAAEAPAPAAPAPPSAVPSQPAPAPVPPAGVLPTPAAPPATLPDATPPPVAEPPTRPATPPTTLPPAPTAEELDEPAAEEPTRLWPRTDPCEDARAKWREAAAALEMRAAALTSCLRAGGYRCRETAAPLAPALTALEWAEQEVEARCE